ncbi:hypothetical protein VSU19_09315 [Verrucomicrobiales bacterium BCK34]|nr:hypothetical protein [Verrucomicrobiales bacterium BCK34]
MKRALANRGKEEGHCFQFIDRWKIHAEREEIAACTLNFSDASRWWPACFLKTEIVSPGDENGVGAEVHALTKGLLPYCLNVVITVKDADPLNWYRFQFGGDLKGTSLLEIQFEGGVAEMNFTSSLLATKSIIRNSPVIFKPVFASNHYWVMRRGEVSFQAEVLRVKDGDEVSTGIPGPTFPHNIPWVVNRIPWGKHTK